MAISPPYGLLAELTHRCPLHCVYCSNPVELDRLESELTTAEWVRVFGEARRLGIVQTHLSGGEPLLRPDLAALVAAAAGQGIYTHLVTSGVGLEEPRLAELTQAGLNSVQLSFQAATPTASDLIAGRKSWLEKEAAASVVKAARLPLTLNVVLHRHNLDELGAILDLAVAWRADRLELAHTQYYSWALRNRDQLLPRRDQLERAVALYRARKQELGHAMELVWVIPDYYERRPKPCMGGWAKKSLTVSPDGTVLPCPVARSITGMKFDSVREHSLDWIWTSSPALTRFRGEDWMPSPCRACDLRTQDFGGCRCQAFALTGDAARTDPVCELSPDHHLVADVVERVNAGDREPTAGLRGATYRKYPGSPGPAPRGP